MNESLMPIQPLTFASGVVFSAVKIYCSEELLLETETELLTKSEEARIECAEDAFGTSEIGKNSEYETDERFPVMLKAGRDIVEY